MEKSTYISPELGLLTLEEQDVVLTSAQPDVNETDGDIFSTDKDV